MNRSDLQSLPVRQLVQGNPNWWNVDNMHPSLYHQTSLSLSSPVPYTSSPSSFHYPVSDPPPSPYFHYSQRFPDSWSQLLLGGLVSEEERSSEVKNAEKLENRVVFPSGRAQMIDMLNGHQNPDLQAVKSAWGKVLRASSPPPCATSLSCNILDFSGRRQLPCLSTECHSIANGLKSKKPRMESTSQSTFKVRKEKLGDRITALHQLVSPFGKTDTASVLLEAIGYIRFLQAQIEALSSPYLGNASSEKVKCGEGEEVSNQDLRSRGLCLVPLSCPLQVERENGADYWAPVLGGGHG